MQFLERFGLVDLQECHGMQGGSGFSTSCVSLARQRGRELTHLGGETRITSPRGSGLGTQLHRHRPLHWGELHVPLSRSAIEGSEGGRRTRPASGRKRCHPRFSHFLMHFRKERYWGGTLRTSTGHPKKPIVQPRGLRTWWRVPLKPDARGSPGKHSSHLWVGLGQRCHTRRGQCSRIFIPEDIRLPSDAAIDIWSSGGAPKVTTGTARDGWARPLGSSTGCSVMEEWEARRDWLGGVFLTVTLTSPRLLTEVGFFWAGPEEELDRGIYEGAPVSSRYWSLDLNTEMVMFPQWEHVPSISATSACARPKHVRQ